MSFRVSVHPKEIIKDFTVQQLLPDHKEISPGTEFPWHACVCVCVCVSSVISPWLSAPSLNFHKRGSEDTHTDTTANRLFHDSFRKCSWVLEVQPTLSINSWSALWAHFGPCWLVVPQRLPRRCSGVLKGQRHFWYPARLWPPVFGGWEGLILRTQDVLATWPQCQSIYLIF